MSFSYHPEPHVIQRSGWLRASVLGANDGIISVTSLIMGMAASGASSQTLLITCIAGLISGATSMAAGEYISVKSQEDIEKSDLRFEARELEKNPQAELKELTEIYISRGLTPELAHEVAKQLTQHDALGAHARDEIGIHKNTAANPVQAAFSCGAALPMLAILLSPNTWIARSVLITGIISLALLGTLSSYFAKTSMLKGSLRITLWGILAMAFSSWVGSLFHVTPI